MNLKHNHILNLFDNESGNTWVFTGGRNTQGGWKQTKGARNFIGHFEEHIRWEKRVDQYVGTRERYVINTGRIGQTITEINAHYDEVVGLYQPRAVAILVGPEDYKQGNEGITLFKDNLEELVGKIKVMGAIPVLQTPAPPKEEVLHKYALSYVTSMMELADRDKCILIIDHFNKCLEKGLNYTKGLLDQQGHLEVAKQLMEETSGSYTSFALEESIDQEPRLDIFREVLAEDSNASAIKALIEQAEDKPLRWLFIGDSITHGALHTHGYDSLPQLFEKFVRDEKGRLNDVVINTAVSGATTKDQIENSKARFERYKDYVDVVIIMFGTNDSVSDVSLEDFRKNLESIISDVKKASAIPVLRTPNPCMDAPNERGTKMIPYIKMIEEYAQEEKIILINHYETWMKAAEKYPYIIKRGYWIAPKDESSIHPGTLGQLQMFHEVVQRLGLWDGESEMARLAYQML